MNFSLMMLRGFFPTYLPSLRSKYVLPSVKYYILDIRVGLTKNRVN